MLHRQRSRSVGAAVALAAGLALAHDTRPDGATAATQPVLTSSPNPSGLGQPFTLTAFVTSASGTGPIPTGTVTFFSALCTQPCAAPVGPIGTSPVDAQGRARLALGGYAFPASVVFFASYSGDANYGGSSGGPLTQVVSAAVGIPALETRNLILLGLLLAASGLLLPRSRNA